MRKKLFTIIMSVMMVAVFMPTMAFAAVTHDPQTHTSYSVVDVEWNADYTEATATVDCDACHVRTTVKSTKVEKEFTSDGTVEATASFDSLQSNVHMPSFMNVVEYYDLAEATFDVPYGKEVNKDGKEPADDEDVFSSADVDAYLDVLALDETDYKSTAAQKAEAAKKVSDALLELFYGESSACVKVLEPAALYAAEVAKWEKGELPTKPERKYAWVYVSELEETLNIDFSAIQGYEMYDEGLFTLPVAVAKKAVPEEDALDVLNFSGLVVPQVYLEAGGYEHIYDCVYVDGKKADVKDQMVRKAVLLDYDSTVHTVSFAAKGLEFVYHVGSHPETSWVDEVEWTSVAPTFKDVRDEAYVYARIVSTDAFGYKSYSEPIQLYVDMEKAKAKIGFVAEAMAFGEHYQVTVDDIINVEGVYDADKAQLEKVLSQVVLPLIPTTVCSKTLYMEELMLGVEKLADQFDEQEDLDFYLFNDNYSFDSYYSNGLRTGNAMTISRVESKTNNPVKQTIANINAKKNVKKTVQLKVARGAKGALTWKKLSGNKKVTVSKDGKLVVKKGLKKGTYKVKVSVTAAGDQLYLAKTVTKTLKVKVK